MAKTRQQNGVYASIYMQNIIFVLLINIPDYLLLVNLFIYDNN